MKFALLVKHQTYFERKIKSSEKQPALAPPFRKRGGRGERAQNARTGKRIEGNAEEKARLKKPRKNTSLVTAGKPWLYF